MRSHCWLLLILFWVDLKKRTAPTTSSASTRAAYDHWCANIFLGHQNNALVWLREKNLQAYAYRDNKAQSILSVPHLLIGWMSLLLLSSPFSLFDCEKKKAYGAATEMDFLTMALLPNTRTHKFLFIKRWNFALHLMRSHSLCVECGRRTSRVQCAQHVHLICPEISMREHGKNKRFSIIMLNTFICLSHTTTIAMALTMSYLVCSLSN